MSFTESEVAGLQTTKYSNVAGMTILIFDYVITLEDEVRWVWGRSWDATRLIFTASRYLPFAGVGMTAYTALRSNSDPCGPGMEDNITHILSIIAAEVLLVIRTYAFWQGDKRVLYGLLAYGGVTICATAAMNVTPNIVPRQQLPPGCFFIAPSNSTFVYLLLLVFETVVLFLTAYRRFCGYREVKTPIVRTTYRDGMFYIICIILITFTNMIVGLLSFQFSDLLNLTQISLHSVLASRIMFNLRKCSYYLQRRDMDGFGHVQSDITYHPPLSSQSNGLEMSRSGLRV